MDVVDLRLKRDSGKVVLRRLLVVVVMMLVVGAVGSVGLPSEPAVAQATPKSRLCDSGETAQFTDVRDSDYAAAYILCMKALGLSQGRDGGYGPDRELNRGQMATFLIRLWTEQLNRQCPTGVKPPFTDTPGTTHEANIDCLFRLGITQGTSATTYSPQDPLTASQITRFLYRTYQTAGGDQCTETDGSQLDQVAECLVDLKVAPTTAEATSTTPVTRAQMGVYMIGLWHNLTNKGLPPTPPQLPTTTTTTTTSGNEANLKVSSIGPRRDENNEPTAEADFLAVDEVAGRYAADTGWLAALEGTLTVPVFVCGPAGQYAADDVKQVTAELNNRLDGFFHRLTSGRIDVVFSEGAAINIDQDFEAARTGPRGLGASILRECDRGVDDASDVSINLIISEFNPCDCHGGSAYLGGNLSVEPDLLFPFSNRGSQVAIHELVHSVLRLRHLKNHGFGYVLVDEENLALYGPEGYWNSLTRPPLADYQYKLLGWPVPEGYSEPPAKLSPSGPSIWWAETTDDGEFTIRWSPPRFVDAPITGYTVEIRDFEGSSQRQDLPADMRTATLRLSNAAKLTGFELGLWANSLDANYRNNNNPVESESETVGSRGDLAVDTSDLTSLAGSSDRGSFIRVAPLPPRVGDVSVSDITSSTVGLTWDAEELIRYESEHKTDGARQFHYQIDYIASDLPDEDPATTCPPVPVRQGSWTERAARSLAAATGCNPTNWVRGDTLNLPNDVFTYRTRETFSGDRVVDAEVFGLDPYTQYTFRVRTCGNVSGLSCSRWSTATASTVGGATLPPPSGIRIASGNDEVLGDSNLVPWGLVTWDPVPGAAAYEIEVVNEDVTFAEGRRVAHSFDLSGNLQGSDSQEIVFKIRSCNILFRGACGDGEWAAVSVPKPTNQDIPPPYGISVKEASDASTKLDYWVPGSANHHPYTLEYQYTDGTSDSGIQHQGRWYRYVMLPTDPNKNYTVKMRNCEGPSAEGNSCSTWTNFAFSTYPATSSVPPPSLRVTDIPDDGHGVTRILWDGVPGALLYDWKLEIAPGNSSGGSKLAGQVSLYINGSPFPKYSDVPITEPGREYTIRIRSCGVPTEPCGDWATTKFST